MLCFGGFLDFLGFLDLSSLHHQSPVLWHVDQGKQGEGRLRPPPIRLPGHQHHQQHLHRYPHLGLAMYQSHQFHSYDYKVISISWSLGHRQYMIHDCLLFLKEQVFNISIFTTSVRLQCNQHSITSLLCIPCSEPPIPSSVSKIPKA